MFFPIALSARGLERGVLLLSMLKSFATPSGQLMVDQSV